jgi:hypothetical protein
MCATFPQDILVQGCKKAGCIKGLLYFFQKNAEMQGNL